MNSKLNPALPVEHLKSGNYSTTENIENPSASNVKQIPPGLWQAFNKARYTVVPNRIDTTGKGETSENNNYVYRALNPRNDYRAQFGTSGLFLVGNIGKDITATHWYFSMNLIAWSQGKDRQTLSVKRLTAEGTEVFIDQGPVELSYQNSISGLKQRLTLHKPNAGFDAEQPVVLHMNIDGHSEVGWKKRDQSISFLSQGRRIFNLVKLQARDAINKKVPIKLALAGTTDKYTYLPESHNLEFILDTRNVSWPVKVDYLFNSFSRGDSESSNEEAWAQGGYTFAIDDDTAVIGAYKENDAKGSAYVFQRTGSAWNHQAKLTASDSSKSDFFGYSVALSGGTVLVGAYGNDSGSAYVFQRSGLSWSLQDKLTASDGTASDRFATSVAIFGDTALIGAYADDDKGSDSGSAYVFQRQGTSWSQQSKLTAMDGSAGDRFGSSVALYGDTALMGVYGDDDKGSDSGSAYVFQRQGTSWLQQGKLTASDGAKNDFFGYSVALSGDTALIGAYQDGAKDRKTGSAYVFLRKGSSWSQQSKLTASDGAVYDYFGYSVALSGDTALIGAYQDGNYKCGNGSAYVFQRKGTRWSLQSKLTASDGTRQSCFGRVVALSGNTALIGASGYHDRGSTSLFVRSGTRWTQQGKLNESDSELFSRLRYSLALSGDTALIGEYGVGIDNKYNPSAYVFLHTTRGWLPQGILHVDDSLNTKIWGSSVALSGDTALIDVEYYAGNGRKNYKIYVFQRDRNVWLLQDTFIVPEGTREFPKGRSVALSGDTALINVEYLGDKNRDKYRAYVFQRDGKSWLLQDTFIVPDDLRGRPIYSSVDMSGDTADITVNYMIDTHIRSLVYVYQRKGNVWSLQGTRGTLDKPGL